LRIQRLVIATHNRAKAGEMAAILSKRFPSLGILTVADFSDAPEPEETGETYAENAVIKAESAAAYTGEWAVADDAGLEIDALSGAPGLRSKRFGGASSPFSEKIARLLEALREVPEESRTARFRCFVALSSPPSMRLEPRARVFSGECEGRIALSPRGEGGFGYDPIFFLPELGRTMAELSFWEKHAVSHRGKVLKAVGDWLAGKGLLSED
jgi:XTP/dITP diphosphohydrolase